MQFTYSLFEKTNSFFSPSTFLSCSITCLPPFSQGNDTDLTGAGEKAESSRYSRSYTSGATLGAELRRGRSRRLSSSLQVFETDDLIAFYYVQCMSPTNRSYFIFMRHCNADLLNLSVYKMFHHSALMQHFRAGNGFP